jgi:hypothetical protein
MKAPKPFQKALFTALFLTATLLAPASGLISAEAANIIHINPGRSAGARGKQIATLESYLLTQQVTVGLDPNDTSDWKADSIQQGLQIWSDAVPDNPFVLARPGQKPMVVVKFVNSIASGGDVQGQVEATRMLHWGNSVSYKIEATLLVRRTTGRRELRQDEITEVIAHELGHLLGLDDAEDCVGLMGPFVPGHARVKPSRAEVDAVLDYRDQLRDAIAKLNQK